MRRLLPLALVAALTAGCGATDGSTGEFTGAEQDVAEVVEELERAAGEDEPQRVCSRVLAQDAVRRLGRDCVRTVERAFDRADTFALAVRSVRVAGDTARARVATGRDEQRTAVLGFVREGRGWRLSSLPGG